MTAPEDLLRELRDGVWLDTQQFPPLRYAVPGLVPEGSTLLVAPPKIGKSWLALDWALAVAAGGRALGAIPTGGERPVLYMALEDGHRRLQDRCRKLLCGEPIPKQFTYLTRTQPGTVVATIGQWLVQHGQDAPLVILDTLGRAMPLAQQGESAYQRDYRVGSALKRQVDNYPGTALTTVHHDRKAGAEDFVDSVSGTHGLAGSADTVLVLSRPRGDGEGVLKVTGRDIPEGEYALRFTEGSAWTLAGRTLAEAASRAREVRAVAGVGDRMGEVIAFVSRTGQASPAEVADAVGLDGRQARVYLGRAVAAGRLRRAGRGTYTPVASVAVLLPDDPETPPESNRATEATPLWEEP